MLSEKGAIQSDIVQTIVGVISQSVEPLHEHLNEALKELSSEELFNELVSTSDFSMAPILEVLNRFLFPNSNLGINTLNSFSIFFAFISEKLDHLCQKSQLALIMSLTSCLKYCYDFYEQKSLGIDEAEMLKEVLAKTNHAYRNVFKISLKYKNTKNLNLYAERRTFVKAADVNFICKEFIRMYESIDSISDSHLIYMKLGFSEMARKSAEGNFSSFLILFIQIFARRFMKYPKYKDTLFGLGISFETIMIAKNINNSEISVQLKKMTSDLYNFLVDHSEIVEGLIENNLFHGSDLDFFRKSNLETNLNLVDAFKLCCRKYLEKRQVGALLADCQDSSNFIEKLLKITVGDCSDSGDLDIISLLDFNEIVEYELFAKIAANNSTEKIIEKLIQAWSRSHFISDSRHQIKFTHLLKLSLLSCTSTGLGDIFKNHIKLSGPFTISSLCLISCFPFSLWQTLEKSQFVSTLASNLLITWKYLNQNETSIDLLSFVLNAISNLVSEAIDLIKKEDLKQIVSFLPATLAILRTNNSMSVHMKHKLAVSMQKLLRGLLMLKDEKIFDIVDHITKLGSIESCLSMFDSWKSLSLFSLTKHSRDTPKFNRIVTERIDTIVPKLLSFSETLSPSTKLMIKHYYRHALYLYMRYTSDINFFNNPIIKSETEALIKYIQDSSETWVNGVFDNTAEESIWKFIYSSFSTYRPSSKQASLPVQICPSLKPSLSWSSTLNNLKDDLMTLQRKIEEMKSSRDASALLNLHEGLQTLLKLNKH